MEQTHNPSVYELTKAEVDMQVATAKAYPRSLTIFQEKAMSMVMISEEVASSCFYAIPRGGKSLEGPSIRFAEIVASAYGNIQYGGRIIDKNRKQITAQGICIDLENNVKASIEVKRKITDKKGITFSEDMQIVTGNAAISIAIRNAILKVIPGALITPIYQKAKELSKGDIETLADRREKAVAYFKSLGVTNEQLLNTLNIAKIDDIDLDKLQILTGMRSALKNKEATIESLFETPNKDAAVNAASNLIEKLKI